MFSLDLDCTQETEDLLIAELWGEGSAGVVELQPGRLRAFFEDNADGARLSEKFGGEVIAAEDRDWVSESQDSLHPMLVGERFFLVPAWRDDPTPAGRLRIQVNNGLAFGTGRHETTRLCIELLEKYVRPQITVLDIGTGSGILAQAAKLLGAGLVVGCDVDPLAIEVAARTGLPVFIGSANAIADGVADVVVANINPECLREIDLVRLLKPGGYAILSGLEIYDELGFKLIEMRIEGQWKALVIQRPL